MENHSIDRNPSGLLRYRDSIYAWDLFICAVVHFDFFTYLSKGSKTFSEICEAMRIKPRPADVLISLLVSMELIEMRGNKYALAEPSATYLVSDTPESLVPYYRSIQNRPQCLEFRDTLRTGMPAGWSSSKKEGKDWIESMKNPVFADSFTAAMDSRGAFLARKLADIFRLKNRTALLDVAGGSGVYACSLAHRNSRLSATVLEIPPVNHAAARSIESKGMLSRVNVIAGNMFEGLTPGYDVHLFANVFHDWDTGCIRKLSEHSFRSLDSGGLIAVFDAHLNEKKDGPLTVAEYSCLLMQ
jgi:acetylserotonin N-methyltransferase